MATMNQNPGDQYERPYRSDGTGAGTVVGVIIALLVVVVFVIFGLPYIRNTSTTPGVPSTGGSDFQTSVSTSTDNATTTRW